VGTEHPRGTAAHRGLLTAGHACQPAARHGAAAAAREGSEFLAKRKLWKTSTLAELFLDLDFVKRVRTGAGKSAFHQWEKKDVLRFAEHFEKRGRENQLYFPPEDSQDFPPSQKQGVSSSVGKSGPTPCPERDAALGSPMETPLRWVQSTRRDLSAPRAPGPGTPKQGPSPGLRPGGRGTVRGGAAPAAKGQGGMPRQAPEPGSTGGCSAFWGYFPALSGFWGV